MNIFVTDEDPVKAALNLDDIRMNKMIVESAQMLSTALRYYGSDHDRLYQMAHINHPCTIWVRESVVNFLWLCVHAKAMCNFYEELRERVHASAPVIEHAMIWADDIPCVPSTPFADCTIFKHLDIPLVEKYRMFMNHKWKHDKIKVTFKGRQPPEWKE